MSFADLLPAVRELPRTEQLRLVHFLIDELSRSPEPVILPDASYPIWSPWDATEAAATLWGLLEREKSGE
jgi:hypothetical protein